MKMMIERLTFKDAKVEIEKIEEIIGEFQEELEETNDEMERKRSY